MLLRTAEVYWQDIRHRLTPYSVLETHNVPSDPTWDRMTYYNCLVRRNDQNFPSMGILVSHNLLSDTGRVLGKRTSATVRRSSEW